MAPGLVVYLTTGDPSLVATYDVALAAIENDAQIGRGDKDLGILHCETADMMRT